MVSKILKKSFNKTLDKHFGEVEFPNNGNRFKGKNIRNSQLNYILAKTEDLQEDKIGGNFFARNSRLIIMVSAIIGFSLLSILGSCDEGGENYGPQKYQVKRSYDFDSSYK